MTPAIELARQWHKKIRMWFFVDDLAALIESDRAEVRREALEEAARDFKCERCGDLCEFNLRCGPNEDVCWRCGARERNELRAALAAAQRENEALRSALQGLFDGTREWFSYRSEKDGAHHYISTPSQRTGAEFYLKLPIEAFRSADAALRAEAAK